MHLSRKTQLIMIPCAAFSLIVGMIACTQAKMGGARMQYEMAPHALSSADAIAGAPYELEKRDFNTERYDEADHQPFLTVKQNPLSTFSIDVDTASYTNVRRMLNHGQLPPAGAVRIEEMVNYFDYQYPAPKVTIDEMLTKPPFNVNMEVNQSPWAPKHQLVRIGLKGMTIKREERPACNLVFLLDVSGSMNSRNKLPLVKKTMYRLLKSLDEKDRVAIAVYAGASGVVLPSTSASETRVIKRAIERLESGGSTNGGEGIQVAYRIAREHFLEEGVNRVILATDGDFNVGVTDRGQLVKLVQENSKDGIDLTILGFGTGNYNDAQMEAISNKGNGNYAYIDSLDAAEKTLGEQVSGTLITIAKDVKIQVEFNPNKVQAYRLIGYENRRLRKEDFNNDQVDAGDIGAGHTVTALYEIIPVGVAVSEEAGISSVDALKYQTVPDENLSKETSEFQDEILTLKLRYKQPKEHVSKKLSFPLKDQKTHWSKASEDFQFAAAVAGFGMLLRDSPYRGQTSYELIEELAEASTGKDQKEYRAEFLELVNQARMLQRRQAKQ